MTKKTDGSEKPQPTEKENVKKIPDTLIPLKRKPDDDDKDDDSKVKKKTKLGEKNYYYGSGSVGMGFIGSWEPINF